MIVGRQKPCNRCEHHCDVPRRNETHSISVTRVRQNQYDLRASIVLSRMKSLAERAPGALDSARKDVESQGERPTEAGPGLRHPGFSTQEPQSCPTNRATQAAISNNATASSST